MWCAVSGVYPENCQLDQMAIIDFNMRNIWKTMSDSWTIIIKLNVRIHGRMHPVNFRLDQVQNSRLAAIVLPRIFLVCETFSLDVDLVIVADMQRSLILCLLFQDWLFLSSACRHTICLYSIHISISSCASIIIFYRPTILRIILILLGISKK